VIKTIQYPLRRIKLIVLKLNYAKSHRTGTILFCVGFLAMSIFIGFNFGSLHLFRTESISNNGSISTYHSSAMFQRDFGRRGNVPLTTWNPKLEVIWKIKEKSPFYSSPAVVSGIVYSGTGDGRILAINQQNGNLVWEYHASGPIYSSPAVAGKLLYIGLQDGAMLAISKDEGDLLWTFQAKGAIFSSPLVRNGYLYFASNEGFVYSLDAVSGQERWNRQLNEGVVSSVSIDGNVLVVACRDRNLYLLDSETGNHRARFRSSSGIDGNAVISDGIIYSISNKGLARSLSVTAKHIPLERTFRTIWAQMWVWQMAPPLPLPKSHNWVSKFSARFLGNMVTDGKRLYLPAFNGMLYGVDSKIGQKIWEFDTGHPKLKSSPIVIGDTVLVGSSEGTLYGLTSADGQEKWKFEIEGGLRGGPVYADGALYLATDEGMLYAIR